ncbi:hypothetical protein [Aeromonas bestiarum]|uniref:hypothetical protein n=1 Tax=Aeromonas bestiarum TaxID=105751 RepID=UPI001ADF1A40|nr:hypothetical protein [Aeromonas bestiarum]
MSSLIFYSDAEQALIATDTLAVKPEGEPLLFCSKAIHLPHLNIVIAGTGQGGFSTRWAMHVNDRMVINGINNLDFHTPQGLRDLWGNYCDEFKITGYATTTVYQFGYCQETDKMVAIAYRSKNNFESEPRPYGLAAKPDCKFPSGDYATPAVFVDMMNEQREIQSNAAKNKRIYIGGRINVLHVTKNGCHSYNLYEFPDYKEHENKLLTNYASERQSSVE